MDPLPDVEFIQGDFHDEAVERELVDLLAGTPVDLVLSDMAPNLSGIAAADAARSLHLAELAADFAPNICNRTVLFSSKLSRAADTVSTSSD